MLSASRLDKSALSYFWRLLPTPSQPCAKLCTSKESLPNRLNSTDWTTAEELALIAHVSTFLDEHDQKLDKAWASPALWTAIPTRKANACKQRWVQLHGIFVTARTLLAWDGFSWVNGHITAASSQVLAAAQKTVSVSQCKMLKRSQMAFNYSHIRRLACRTVSSMAG